MKKIAIIGIVALVVIGCVLAAGCTSTSTTPASSASGAALDVTLPFTSDVLSETEIATLIDEIIVKDDVSEMTEDEIIEFIDDMSAEELLSIINVSPASGTMTEDEMMASLTDDSNPLFILDGIEVIDFSSLSQDDIEALEVLKDASSALYGVNGNNYILIRT